MASDLEGGVRVRMAPSPTGQLHIGTARTALFNWLFARKNKGVFVLRIEDTDTERSKKEFEQEIFEGFKWLGIDWDEGPSETGFSGKYGPYRQSERTTIYRKYLEQLLAEKKAYYCYCTKEELEAARNSMLTDGLPPKYNGHCRNLESAPTDRSANLIRFVVSGEKVRFVDLIRGEVSFDSELFGDIVIAKSLDEPLYNFAVVVDDELMKISHVIRGEDHLSNTPKQILIQKALDFKVPVYAHLPLILAPDKSKLSKRYGETSLLLYREKGYLPEALLNFMVLLGWHPENDQEIFSVEELVQKFEMERVQKSGAVFNEDKLDWLNGNYIKSKASVDLVELLWPEIEKRGIQTKKDFVLKIIETEKERLKTLADFFEMADFFFVLPEYEKELLIWKESNNEEAKQILQKIKDRLSEIPTEIFNKDHITPILEELSGEGGRGRFFWPFRVALSGKKGSPDPVTIAEILGKNEVLERLNFSIDKL